MSQEVKEEEEEEEDHRRITGGERALALVTYATYVVG